MISVTTISVFIIVALQKVLFLFRQYIVSKIKYGRYFFEVTQYIDMIFDRIEADFLF